MHHLLRNYALLCALPVLLAQATMSDAEPVASHLLFFNALPWHIQPYDKTAPAAVGQDGTSAPLMTATSIPGPLHMRAPLWLAIDQAAPAGRWHAPLLSPAVARAAQQEREAQRARRMADRAFYFGLDVDNDALK